MAKAAFPIRPRSLPNRGCPGSARANYSETMRCGSTPAPHRLRRPAMKDGFRVYDTDTHIDPGAAVLEKYVDPGFRARLDDLAPYRVTVKSRTVDGGERTTYRFEQRLYERTLGEAEASPGPGDGRMWRGKRRPSFGVIDDRSDNRVLDMDEEGSDVHFLVPSVWTSIV